MSPSSSSPLALSCLVAALVLVLQGGGLGGGEQGQAAAMNVPGEEENQEILLFSPLVSVGTQVAL